MFTPILLLLPSEGYLRNQRLIMVFFLYFTSKYLLVVIDYIFIFRNKRLKHQLLTTFYPSNFKPVLFPGVKIF